jgi:protein-glutamine gamma-glutamyltransferase
LFARFGLDATDWRSVLIALAVSLGGLGLLAGLVALLRRPRDRRDPAQRALDRLSRRLRRHDLAREPHETAAAYAARVRDARPELAGPLADFAQAYTHLRYADLDAQERAQFQQQLWRALSEAKR